MAKRALEVTTRGSLLILLLGLAACEDPHRGDVVTSQTVYELTVHREEDKLVFEVQFSDVVDVEPSCECVVLGDVNNGRVTGYVHCSQVPANVVPGLIVIRGGEIAGAIDIDCSGEDVRIGVVQ